MSRRETKMPGDEVNDELREILERVTPGTPLREGLERVIQQGTGALIVLGSGHQVDALCSGGFRLLDSLFTAARLAELSKMDGAIVLDDSCRFILRANVHLHPEASLPTTETGSRHRTAERVAAQVGKPVIAVSEERHTATLYIAGEKRRLRDPEELIAEVGQTLQTIERFRRRLDEAVERLTRLEVADQMTFRQVALVLQRAELALRLSQRVGLTAAWLGGERSLIELQLTDLTYGVDRLRDQVLRDYVRPSTEVACREAMDVLAMIPEEHLTWPERVGSALGFSHLDAHVRPAGVRLLAQVPRLPDAVRDALIAHFGDYQKLLFASVDQLDKVEGIGQSRARELRRLFDRIIGSEQPEPSQP